MATGLVCGHNSGAINCISLFLYFAFLKEAVKLQRVEFPLLGSLFSDDGMVEIPQLRLSILLPSSNCWVQEQEINDAGLLVSED